MSPPHSPLIMGGFKILFEEILSVFYRLKLLRRRTIWSHFLLKVGTKIHSMSLVTNSDLH